MRRSRTRRGAGSTSSPRRATPTTTTSRCSPRSARGPRAGDAGRGGAEVELKLLEVDLHDLGAAVGKVEGLDVVVADTAKLVGKKVKVVVGRVLDGQAFATLVDDDVRRRSRSRARPRSRPAPARRKTGEETAEAAAPEPEAEAEAEETEPSGDAALDAAEAVVEDDAEAGPAKKRTRRGAWGKRRRSPRPRPARRRAEADDEAEVVGVAEAAEDLATGEVEPAEPVAAAAKPKTSSRRRRRR